MTHLRAAFALLLSAALLILATGCQQGQATQENAAPTTAGAYGALAPDAVKLLIAQDGAVRVTAADLREAGLNAATISSTALNLTHMGTQVPFVIDGDALIFYGQAPTSRYAATRPYILRSDEPGLLMDNAAELPDGAVQTAVGQQLTLEENKVYTSNARSAGSEDVWFWEIIQPGAVTTISATLPTVAEAPATLRASFYGASYNHQIDLDHDLEVFVNDVSVGPIAWDGQVLHEATLSLPAGVLHSGINTIRFDNSAPGATFVDIMQLNSVTLSYSAPPLAVDDRLQVRATTGTVQLQGFSGPPRLFDISDPALPRRLPVAAAAGESVAVTVAGSQTVLAVGPNGFRRPAALIGLRSSNWSTNDQGADLIIIAADPLLPALAPLIAARKADGLRVAAVPLAEIYDEFGHGADSPLVIQRFIAHAYASWQAPAPRYVLLVGDATYDFRGYLGAPPVNLVPSPIVAVEYSGETVSDSWLGDIDGNGIPELAVGRWPVSDPTQVTALVTRTLAYETGSASEQIVLTADGTEVQFGLISDRFITSSSIDEASVSRLYGASAGEVTGAWNQGAWLLTYTGHGSLDKWGREEVFSQEAVAEIGSDATPPIVLQFTCLTGFFAHPRIQSLTEAMMLNSQGPVLLLGASSLTLSTHQEPLAVNLLNTLPDAQYERVGDALLAAKALLNVENNGIREVSETFGLFGDPSARIVRPVGSSG